METIRTNQVSAGSHLINETFRMWDGDTLVIYHEDSEDNFGVKGKAGTTRRVCAADYPPLRMLSPRKGQG